MTDYTQIQVRQDTSARWASINPILLAGELGYATDTKVLKKGDGTTVWNSLPEIADKATTLAGYGITDAANIGLSNLSSDGQMIIDSQNGTISNCILDIPQNIILELSGNTLTAKSGSVLTDSGSTYQTITLITDKTLEIPNTADLKRMVFATSSGTLSLATFDVCVSGATDSLAGVPYHIWFDTSNQEVNYYGSDGTTASHRTYPLCIVETDANGVASFAKNSNGNYMIFNGAGFIGQYAFVYPGIKMLSPMGLDSDGKLKSELNVTNSLTIVSLGARNSICYYSSTTIATRTYLGEYKTIDEAPTNVSSGIPVVYISSENKSYQFSNNQWTTNATQQKAIVLIKYTTSGTTVTDFVIRQPIKTATSEMLDKIIAGEKPFTNNLVIEGDNKYYEILDTALIKGTYPSADARDSYIQINDANDNILAGTFYRINTNGTAYNALFVYKYEDNTNLNAQIGIYYEADGTTYATCPTPANGDNSNKIATTKWVNDKFAQITGYDASKTQTLKNVSGTLTWVDD